MKRTSAQTKSSDLLVIRDLGASYARSGVPCIYELDLRIGAGEMVGLAGASGVGKTTLLRTIAGQLEPVRGAIEWKAPQHAISYCPQDDVLIAFRTVWENAALLLEAGSLDDRDLSFAVEAIDAVGLSSALRRRPDELSSGMRQRLQVIQALAPRHPLVLLDEPFSQQDRDHQRRQEDLIWTSVRGRNQAAVVVSHDIEALAAICDRLIFLGDSPARVIASLETPATLKPVGGRERRERTGFADFALAGWAARAEAALL